MVGDKEPIRCSRYAPILEESIHLILPSLDEGLPKGVYEAIGETAPEKAAVSYMHPPQLVFGNAT